jgi:hypothetical protein
MRHRINNLGPLADVVALVSAFTDAMNLRHLRSESTENRF